MPIVEEYRGVGIHDFQDSSRITAVVKPAIDYVFSLTDPELLFVYAADAANPPEARLFARDRYAAARELQARDHTRRLDRLEELDARIAGVGSLGWAHPDCYCSLLDRPRSADAAPRPPHQRERLKEFIRD